MSNIKQQKKETLREEETAKKQEPKSKLTPEAQSVIHDGREYIKNIRQSNENILRIEVSEKISRMEKLVEKIFQQVELHPESISNLRRLMEYYLPMTIKLLDKFFQDASLDISTDISVLQSMLAQDGLIKTKLN